MTTPSKFGRYEIKSELGRGGMATVYRAYDPSFDRQVAIKVLPREMLHDPQFRPRFERELKIVAALEHPAIVPVYDVGEEDGQPYFVMRYMSGGSLTGEIKKGNFSLEETARIISRIAQGLVYAHKKGVVHRDLKPDNILFDDSGDPFISDFGIAKLTESNGSSLTGSGIIGTPAYMSPEQVQGNDVDGRSDVYGLGVIVYQMLSGQQPYHADTPMGVAIKHVTEPVPDIRNAIPSLSAEVDTVIKNSMAKDRNDRYPTPTDLARNLHVTAFGHDVTLPPANGLTHRSELTTTAKPTSRRKTGWVVAGALIVALLAAGFLFRNQIPGLAQALATTTSTPLPTATKQPPTATVAPTKTAIPTITSVVFAPFCQPDTLQVTAPTVLQTNIDCVLKKPYTTVSIPLDATFESLSSEMTCEVVNTRESDMLVSCTGQQLYTYELKVCSPQPALPESGGQCDDGTGFDAANSCCVKPPAEDAGCTIYQMDMKKCGG
jgi:serine/threonine protein kinase